MKILLLKILFFFSAVGIAQQPGAVEIEAMARHQFLDALAQLDTFLRIPNESKNLVFAAQNASYCVSSFEKRGFTTRLIPTATAPFVFAEKQYPGATKTLLFYLQIDGQPVDASAWQQPDPYHPVVKQQGPSGIWEALESQTLSASWNPDWRLFARSASDSKGPAACLLAALDALQANGIQPSFNVKVIMDLEEEISSPHLPGVVRQHRQLFAADALIIMDGTRHISNKPTLTFGARGIADATLTVFGPSKSLHSGQYGNYAPNPVFALAQLLASMKDTTGRVLIDGWYEGVELSTSEKVRLAQIPENEPELLKRLGIARAEQVAGTYQEALQFPSLNVRGLSAAYVGEQVRTLIPDKAIAEFDLRLVPETPGNRQLNLLRKHIEGSGFYLVDSLPTEQERATYPRIARLQGDVAYEAFRTPFESELGTFLSSALSRAFAAPPIMMRTTGGSQPMGPFIAEMGLDAVAVRIPNPDNNIHAANENLRLGNFLEGIQSCIAILTEEF